MIRLAIAGLDRCDVSTFELDRPGTTYTVDMVRARLAALGPGGEVFFLLGADQALDLPAWREARELVRLCTMAPVPRPGFPLGRLDALRAALSDDAVEAMKRRVLDMPPVDVSSTDIRARVKRGEPIAGMVPDAVARYIAEHGLYR